MTARELLRAGDVDGALKALPAEVRAAPADVTLRTFLFQLLAVTGDWDRALTQLNVAGEMAASTLPMVETYREALRCEALRAAVFAGERSPLVFGEPERWIALMLEALRQQGAGKPGEAARLRAEALAEAPATAGTINGEAFEWLADGDSRIGPVLEVILNGNYYWIPVHRIASVAVDAPEDLRDMVWLPGHFTWANGGQSVGLMPVRYPGSEAAADGRLRLARLTDFQAISDDTFIGLGQRELVTDQGEYPLLEVRSLTFGTGAGAPA